MRYAAVIISVLLFPLSCLAGDSNLMQDVIYLDPYVVTDTAEEDNLNKSNLRVEEKSRSNTIADFLFNDTEISFKRKANIGDSGDVISIRGFRSKQIMLNLDGREISSVGIAGGNYIDFGTIPLDNIERIEIVKGGSSIEYGNKALGGVINAYTKAPDEDPYLSFYATSGVWGHVHDFHNVRASYAQSFGLFGVSVGASHQYSEAYLRNNDYESIHVYPKAYLDTPWDGQLVLGYNYSYTDRGLIRSNRDDGDPTSDGDPTLPGYDSSIDGNYPTSSGEYFAGGRPTPAMNVIGEDAYWVKKRHLFDINYHQLLGDDAYFNIMLFKNHENRIERNYADVGARMQLKATNDATYFIPDPFNTGVAQTHEGDLVLERNVTVDKSYGAKVKVGWDLESHSLIAGWEYKCLEPGGIKVNYVDTNYNAYWAGGWTGVLASSEAGPAAYITGLFLGDKYAITDNLLLDFGVRYDRFAYTPDQTGEEVDNHQLSPKVTLTYDFNDQHTITLAGYMNYRTPTIPELYWSTQASLPGSTNVPYLTGVALKPESQLGFDAAYRYRFEDGGSVQVSGYYYDVKDYIMHKSVSSPAAPSGSTWAAFNTDATIYGVTLQASYPLLDTLSGQFSMTWQKTKKDNDPSDPDNILERLDYIPDVKATAGLTWDILDDLVLDTTLNYVGERDYSISTSALTKGTLDDYFLLGMSLRYQLDEHTVLELYGDNLTNSDYEESWGYPSMGTNIGVSLKWEL